MSSTASTEDSSLSESDNDCFPDINKLKPYDLEPEISSNAKNSSFECSIDRTELSK